MEELELRAAQVEQQLALLRDGSASGAAGPAAAVVAAAPQGSTEEELAKARYRLKILTAAYHRQAQELASSDKARLE